MEKSSSAGTTSRYLFNVPALTVLICGGLQTLPSAAQESDEVNAPRDAINISSGYFSKDYANNVDYAQILLDESRGVERLSMLGYEKYADNLSSWGSRGAYFVGTNLVTMLSNLRLTYHEWGHASRTVAMGKKSVYAVVSGRRPGLYPSWEQCLLQVKGFPQNRYKGFESEREALQYLSDHGVAAAGLRPPWTEFSSDTPA